MSYLKPDRQDVIDCYRNILGREPEDERVIDLKLNANLDFWGLILEFVHSNEFKQKAGERSVYSMRKCFSETYLARGLTKETRSACVAHNYAVLQNSLSVSSFSNLLDNGLVLLSDLEAYPELRIDALLFHSPADEGEITLALTVRGRRVAILAFTIVPAAEFDVASESALFISLIQGDFGAADETREVTRRLGDISPPYLLMCVLEGIADALGIKIIVGVDAYSQPSFRDDFEMSYIHAYDGLFSSLGSTRGFRDFHVMEVPRRARPLDTLPRSHRARTRRKRAAKQVLITAASNRWASYSRKTAL